MSRFCTVDDQDDPQALVALLDASARGLAAMKHYIATTHALRAPSRPVLDIGCGPGHDLALLSSRDVACIGVDPSVVMLSAAATRTGAPVVRAAGERLPFRDGAFSGCRIERVLMHLADPALVLREAVRCTEADGLLTIFEPDWTSLFLEGASSPSAGWLSAARNPAIGSELGTMLVAAGCTVVDRVEERSWWTFDEFERHTNLGRMLPRAVAEGRIERSAADSWLAEQRERGATGSFFAEIVKVCWIARKNWS